MCKKAEVTMDGRIILQEIRKNVCKFIGIINLNNNIIL